MLDLFDDEVKDIKSNLIRDFLDNSANSDNVELNLLFYIDIIDHLNKIDESNKNILLRSEKNLFDRKNYGAVLSINLEKIVNKVIKDACHSEFTVFELYTNLLVTLLYKYNEFLKKNFYEQDYSKLSSNVQHFEEIVIKMKFEKLPSKKKTLKDLLQLMSFFSKFCVTSSPTNCIKIVDKIVNKMDIDTLLQEEKKDIVKTFMIIFNNCGQYKAQIISKFEVIENFDNYYKSFNEKIHGLSNLVLMDFKKLTWVDSKLEEILKDQPDNRIMPIGISSGLFNIIVYLQSKNISKAKKYQRYNNICIFNSACIQNNLNISDYYDQLIETDFFKTKFFSTEDQKFYEFFKEITNLEKIRRWGKIDYLNKDEMFISSAIKKHFPSIFKNYNYKIYEQYFFSKYVIDFMVIIPELKLKIAIEYFGNFYTFPNGEHKGKTKLKFKHIKNKGIHLVEFKTDENFLRLINYNDHNKIANILAFSIADIVYKEKNLELNLSFNKTIESIK